MAYRKRMNKKRSRRSFSNGAMRVHKKNLQHAPTRGGIRL